MDNVCTTLMFLYNKGMIPEYPKRNLYFSRLLPLIDYLIPVINIRV